MQAPDEHVEPVKDAHAQHPIASVWRPILREIVKALARGDYALEQGIRFVAQPSLATTKQIANYIASFGETLTELPDETWSSSASQWMSTHWELLVDLWTVESGSSDLVLDARVYEEESGFRFEIDSVYVP